MKKQNLTLASLAAIHAGDFGNALAALTPGGIERQEKQGQIDESFRETLPIDGTLTARHGNKDPRATWEKLGFVFGDKADDMFINVKFPEGWKKRPTDHSMWTDLVDAKGRKRGGIFYKAAFYDRSAHVHLSRRFGIEQDYADGPQTVSITDACGEVKQSISGLEKPNWGDREQARKAGQAIDAAQAQLSDWLNEHYPNHEDASAYWD